MATPTSATSWSTPPVCSPSSPSNLFLNACMLPHDHLPRRLELPISIYKRYPTIPKIPQSLIPPPFVLEDYLIYSFWVRLLDCVPMLIMSMKGRLPIHRRLCFLTHARYCTTTCFTTLTFPLVHT